MIEFKAQTGGRYTYVDDVINLQELALAFGSLFAGCSNFIISGCEVSGDAVSTGYVYINGKVRYFNGASGISTWPQRIYEQNRVISLSYANGQDKVGRHAYGCAIASPSSVPSTDPITEAAPQYIELSENGNALRMTNAFFGPSCMLLNPDDGSQTVQGNTVFAGDVTIDGTLNLDSLTLRMGNSIGRLYHDESGRFVLQNKVGSGVLYAETISNSTGFIFSADGAALLTIGDGAMTGAVPFAAPRLSNNNVTIANGNLYEHAANSDNGTISINMLGYNGGSLRYRDTVVGNGKGVAVITVDGSESNVAIDGTIVANSAVNVAFVLKSTYENDNDRFLKTVVIEDANDNVSAIFGYNTPVEGTLSSVTGKALSIINNIGIIDIAGAGYVNIGPAIYENGVALTSKYVQRSELPSWVFGSAPTSGMTQAMCDERYARLSNGLSQFIRGANTAAVLRSQIGAIGQSDADARYARLNMYLADMAHTEAEKALIRQNIGAAAVSLQYSIYDSGWIDVKGGLLFGRQWGKVVSLQGNLYARYTNQQVFTIPTGIAPPAHDVELVAGNDLGTSSDYTFRVKIAAGQRNAIVTHCPPSMYDALLTVTLTYMVA